MSVCGTERKHGCVFCRQDADQPNPPHKMKIRSRNSLRFLPQIFPMEPNELNFSTTRSGCGSRTSLADLGLSELVEQESARDLRSLRHTYTYRFIVAFYEVSQGSEKINGSGLHQLPVSSSDSLLGFPAFNESISCNTKGESECNAVSGDRKAQDNQ